MIYLAPGLLSTTGGRGSHWRPVDRAVRCVAIARGPERVVASEMTAEVIRMPASRLQAATHAGPEPRDTAEPATQRECSLARREPRPNG